MCACTNMWFRFQKATEVLLLLCMNASVQRIASINVHHEHMNTCRILPIHLHAPTFIKMTYIRFFFFLLVCINVWSLKVMIASICANILKQAITLNWYVIDSVEVNQSAKSNMLILYMARLENSHRIWKVARSAIWNRCYVTVSVDRVDINLPQVVREAPISSGLSWVTPACTCRDLISSVLPGHVGRLLFLSKTFLSHLDERHCAWKWMFCIVKCLWHSSHEVWFVAMLLFFCPFCLKFNLKAYQKIKQEKLIRLMTVCSKSLFSCSVSQADRTVGL